MKAKVIRSFIDKETKAVRKLDEVFDCTQKRYDELAKGGFVIAVAEKKEKEVKSSN